MSRVRKSDRPVIRRATVREAERAREFIAQTFTDRISWVAARVLLERAAVGLEGSLGGEEHVKLIHDVQTFLERHPAPKRESIPTVTAEQVSEVLSGPPAPEGVPSRSRTWEGSGYVERVRIEDHPDDPEVTGG